MARIDEIAPVVDVTGLALPDASIQWRRASPRHYVDRAILGQLVLDDPLHRLGGDPQAAERLLPAVYDELRKLAAAKLAEEKPGQTLDATALELPVQLGTQASPGG